MVFSVFVLFCFVLFLFTTRTVQSSELGGGGGVGQVILLRDYQHLFLNRRFDGRPASKD